MNIPFITTAQMVEVDRAMIEIRRSPWKVLYRPTEKELENELLYEATRSFAVAAADMKAASVSVNWWSSPCSRRASIKWPRLSPPCCCGSPGWPPR